VGLQLPLSRGLQAFHANPERHPQRHPAVRVPYTIGKDDDGLLIYTDEDEAEASTTSPGPTCRGIPMTS